MSRPRQLRSWIGIAALAAAAVSVACSGGGADGADRPAEGVDAAPTARVPTDRDNRVAELGLFQSDERAVQLRLLDLQDAFDRDFPNTDPANRTVDLREIFPALPRDAIESIRQPTFTDQEAAAAWLGGPEPVIALQHNGEVRAYPLQILTWHEIVNDIVGGEPLLITYCPLCNTAIVFRREVAGTVREFGVSGMLRANDLIMYDSGTETLWQQITGEGIVGTEAGARLEFLPAQIVSFAEFRETFPDAAVLDRPAGTGITYGTTPYVLYDSDEETRFPIVGARDGRLDAKERVLTVELNEDPAAFPFSVLAEDIVVTTEVGGVEVVAFWQPGAVSPLDSEFIIGGRNVGSAGAFLPLLDGERLTFEERDGAILDRETGSEWNVLGRAVAGPLAGAQLEPLISANHFWFAWAVFQPETRVITGSTTP